VGQILKYKNLIVKKTTTSKGYYRICLLSVVTEFLLSNYIFQEKLLIMEVAGHVIMYFLGKGD
jgi:hypothetical protein